MRKVTEIVWQLAEPIALRHGCELWDVEYKREGGTWYLRVFIDNPDGVSISHCEAVSRELDPELDRADPIKESYVLEVSSAGLERPLKRESDFLRFMGSLVEVRLFKPKDGVKEYIGTLEGYKSGNVCIDTDGKRMEFEASEIAQVRLRLEF